MTQDTERQRAVHRRLSRRRRQKTLAVVPTLITLGNLVAGFAAIHYAAKPIEAGGPWGWSSLTVAGALVFLGLLLDGIDGSVARITKGYSQIGAELDSLGDLITCGVAPAFMMLRLVSHYFGAEGGAVILGPEADTHLAKVLWGVAAVFVCCTALRLARFNVESHDGPGRNLFFRGLPSPGAAGAIASLIIFHQHWLHMHDTTIETAPVILARYAALGIPLVTLLCALAMVSSIPYVHFTNRYVLGQQSFGYVAALVVAVFLAIWWLQELLAIAFTLYAIWSPLRLVFLRGRRRFARATQ